MELNPKVTSFLDNLNQPLRDEIELIRKYILASYTNLTENIKWKGPNYCFNQNIELR